MLDRDLKRVIAGVSVATLMIIIVFVALAVLLTTHYDVGVRRAYAEGTNPTQSPTQTPTPTPTPYWTYMPQRSGAAIKLNGTTVTTTVNVAFDSGNPSWLYYGFTATAAEDKDTLYNWNGSQMSPSVYVDNYWPVDGVFQTALPTAPTSVTLTAIWEDNDTVGDKDYQLTATATVYVVGVGDIDVKEHGAWINKTGGTIQVMSGVNTQFRARPNPSNAQWPSNCPQWIGPVTENNGSEVTCQFSESTAKYVSAGPDDKTVNVEVISFSDPLEYKSNDDGPGDPDDYYKYDGGGVNNEVRLLTPHNYRAMFRLDDVTTHTHDCDPINIHYIFYDTDPLFSNTILAAGSEKAFTFSAPYLCGARVRFYIDENMNNEYDSSEITITKNISVVADREIHMNVVYAASIGWTTQQALDFTSQTLHQIELYVKQREDPNDYRALIAFHIDSVTSYTVAQAPEIIESQDDLDELCVCFEPRTIFIAKESLIGTMGTNFLGADQILIVPSTPDYIVGHELGHTRSNDDIGPPNCPCAPSPPHPIEPATIFNKTRIMYHDGWTALTPQTYLTQAEAYYFEND